MGIDEADGSDLFGIDAEGSDDEGELTGWATGWIGDGGWGQGEHEGEDSEEGFKVQAIDR